MRPKKMVLLPVVDRPGEIFVVTNLPLSSIIILSNFSDNFGHLFPSITNFHANPSDIRVHKEHPLSLSPPGA